MVRRRSVAAPESQVKSTVSVEDGRGVYTFTDCEMSICRSAQLASYTGENTVKWKWASGSVQRWQYCGTDVCPDECVDLGIGRNRTVAPSYMGSSDWSKGSKKTCAPPDYTKILDQPWGSTKKEYEPKSQLSPIKQMMMTHGSERPHSRGVLGLEVSKNVYTALQHRFDSSGHASALQPKSAERYDLPTLRSNNGTPLNPRLSPEKYSPELAGFERKVQSARGKVVQPGAHRPSSAQTTTPRPGRGRVLSSRQSFIDWQAEQNVGVQEEQVRFESSASAVEFARGYLARSQLPPSSSASATSLAKSGSQRDGGVRRQLQQRDEEMREKQRRYEELLKLNATLDGSDVLGHLSHQLARHKPFRP